MQALRRVLRIALDPATIKGADYTIRFANDAFLDFVGRPEADCIGGGFWLKPVMIQRDW